MNKKSNFKLNSVKMMPWARDLFPINRSISGKGIRKTIKYIQKKISKKFKNKKISTNSKVYDWKIPKEWDIKKAYILDHQGQKICDFKENNLHLLGYSKSVNKILNYNSLKKNIYFLKDKPNAIPYRTSYYKKNAAFFELTAHLLKVWRTYLDL